MSQRNGIRLMLALGLSAHASAMDPAGCLRPLHLVARDRQITLGTSAKLDFMINDPRIVPNADGSYLVTASEDGVLTRTSYFPDGKGEFDVITEVHGQIGITQITHSHATKPPMTRSQRADATRRRLDQDETQKVLMRFAQEAFPFTENQYQEALRYAKARLPNASHEELALIAIDYAVVSTPQNQLVELIREVKHERGTTTDEIIQELRGQEYPPRDYRTAQSERYRRFLISCEYLRKKGLAREVDELIDNLSTEPSYLAP